MIGIDDEDDSTFTITVDQKTFHFQGKTPPPPLLSLTRSPSLPPFCTHVKVLGGFKPVSGRPFRPSVLIHPRHLFALSLSLPLPSLPFDGRGLVRSGREKTQRGRAREVTAAVYLHRAPLKFEPTWAFFRGGTWTICSTASPADTLRTERVRLCSTHSIAATPTAPHPSIVAEQEDHCSRASGNNEGILLS